MIQFARISFPGSEIVVMGVTDRGVKRDGDTTYTSINSAPALSRHQKAAADSQGALFWDTCEAMERHGGLETFADKGWIASDRVHFKFSGGKGLAEEMEGSWEEMIVRKVRESRKESVIEAVEADSSMFGTAEVLDRVSRIAGAGTEAMSGNVGKAGGHPANGKSSESATAVEGTIR